MRLLIISHVLPWPGEAGQQLRVRYTLEAAVRNFQVDFLTFASSGKRKVVEDQLAVLGCRPIVFEACLPYHGLKQLMHSLASGLFVRAAPG